MKNLVILILHLVAALMGLAFIFALLNYFFGLHLGMKGQEVPDDPRAAFLFLGIGLVCGAIAYFGGRKKK
jgi:hypothetical protein